MVKLFTEIKAIINPKIKFAIIKLVQVLKGEIISLFIILVSSF